MSLDISVPEQQPVVLLTPKITVIGVGGAGGNAINNMIQSNLEGVDFVVANTDAQALKASLAETKIQLGIQTTKGQGAGARPEVGKESAEEAASEISGVLDGANMVFITAGMGGGTGTGAAPVIAKMARERDILTVGVVTKPFTFEGRHRMAIAERGIEEMAQYVDTLIVIPNQNLFLVADEKMTFAEAFKRADQVLQGGVRSITDLIITPGIINLDFSDVRTVMAEMGRAMMGMGTASGEGRALAAAEEAISNPLLDDASMTGAKGILINIAGGNDLTLYEVDEAANRIRREVDPEANIIFGASFDETLEGSIRVSVVATGITRSQESGNPFQNNSALFGAAASKPAATPAFTAPTFTKPEPVVQPQPHIEHAEAPEPEAEQEDISTLEDEIPALPAQHAASPSALKEAPSFVPKSSNSVFPAMPSPNALFGISGEQRHAPAFEPLTAKPAPQNRFPSFMGEPQQAPRPQEDLFASPAPQPVPPVVPAPVKPVEKEKSRPSLFQFVTRRNQPAADSVDKPAEEENDLPAFLRH